MSIGFQGGSGSGAALTAAQSADLAKIDDIIPDAGVLVPPTEGFVKGADIWVNETGAAIAMPSPRTVANIEGAGFTRNTGGGTPSNLNLAAIITN